MKTSFQQSLRQILGTFVYHYGIEANHPVGDLVEPYDEAIEAILALFLSLPGMEEEEYTAFEAAGHMGEKGYRNWLREQLKRELTNQGIEK